MHDPGQGVTQPAAALKGMSGRDEHSLVADAMFIDPAAGDYRVRDGSPALRLGFVNFAMDQFGVQYPKLKAIAPYPGAAGSGRGKARHSSLVPGGEADPVARGDRAQRVRSG